MRYTITKAFIKLFVSTLVLGSLSLSSFAAIESYEFSNDIQRERYQHFIEDMRCPKCQNQNLANSDSPISADLRRVIYEQIRAGRSDTEITDFMVSRYGDFILYNPRMNSKTSALWLTPVIIVLLGIFVIVMVIRHRRKLSTTSNRLSANEQSELAGILEANPVAEESSNRKEPVMNVSESVESSKKTTTKKPAAKKATAKAVEEKPVTAKKSTTTKATETKKPVKPKAAAAKPKSDAAKPKTTATKSSAKKAAPATKAAKADKPAAKVSTAKSPAKAVKATPKTAAKKS